MTRWSLSALALAALLLTAPAHAAKLLVLEASPDAGFQKGDTVDGSQKLSVDAFKYVVLMDESGQVVTVRGPYNGVPGGEDRADGPSLLTRMAAIVTTEGTSGSTTLGLTRSLGNPLGRKPTIWSVNVATSGTKCTKPDAAVDLFRPAPHETFTITLLHRGTKERSSFEWPTKELVMPWPKELKAVDGGTYEIRFAPPEMNREFTLRFVPATLATDPEILGWMATVGCTVQAKAMIDELSDRHVVDGATSSNGKVFK